MANQITITFGRNDRELAEFLTKREELPDTNDLGGVNIRNQLYALMRIVKELP
jgi:hypothetical protein